MAFSCTTENYDSLYARWLVNPGMLLEFAEWEPGQDLLDLCGGTGAVTREALRQGADPTSIVLLDINPRAEDTGVLQVKGKAEDVRPVLAKRQFDVVVCRQSFAYLDLSTKMARSIGLVLKDDGVFVFNTFPWPRSGTRWVYKSYDYEGRRYYEASLCLSKHVWHLQVCPGTGFDVTRFHGYTEDEIREKLEPFFRVHVYRAPRSIRWVCRKRDMI